MSFVPAYWVPCILEYARGTTPVLTCQPRTPEWIGLMQAITPWLPPGGLKRVRFLLRDANIEEVTVFIRYLRSLERSQTPCTDEDVQELLRAVGL